MLLRNAAKGPDSTGGSKPPDPWIGGVPDDVVQLAVAQTENVSASFIRELMRRSIQFALCRTEGEPSIAAEDIQQALEELLVTGGSLNRKLLGAERRVGFNGTFEAPVAG